ARTLAYTKPPWFTCTGMVNTVTPPEASWSACRSARSVKLDAAARGARSARTRRPRAARITGTSQLGRGEGRSVALRHERAGQADDAVLHVEDVPLARELHRDRARVGGAPRAERARAGGRAGRRVARGELDVAGEGHGVAGVGGAHEGGAREADLHAGAGHVAVVGELQVVARGDVGVAGVGRPGAPVGARLHRAR